VRDRRYSPPARAFEPHVSKPLPVIVLAAAFALAGAAPAAAKSDNCPKEKGTLAKEPLGRIWHRGHSLFGCTVVFDIRPRARRLGPWAPGTKVAWDGVQALWTVPLVRNGVRSDRMWSADAEDGTRWLKGKRLVPKTAQAPAHEARVQQLIVADQGGAWITRGGDAVLFVRQPNGDPVAVGTPPAPLTPDGELLLVGTFTGVAPSALAATAKLHEGEGDGDECGGSNPYTLTVQPDPAAPPLGATWTGDWVRPDC
jgi:hypothetical protein